MAATNNAIVVPEGFALHTENTAHILLPATQDTFLNPIQEFNRDISVACIRTWSEDFSAIKKERWRKNMEKNGEKKVKGNKTSKEEESIPVDASKLEEGGDAVMNESTAEFTPYRFTLLEALSATGLRSIRYANEIPLVRHVIANDLLPAAVQAITRNVDMNGLGSTGPGDAVTPGKVRVNEGDACDLMYSHRGEKNRVDCVDLDPYGTAAPFIDAAVQCVADGGLLCVTCTDLAVLAGNNYPEKCFANYGGIPVKAEYTHEAALRLVIHMISTSAARYGRYVHPLLSLSIDFYVRIFVRIRTQAAEVKKAASNTATYYICCGCQSFYEQPLGKVVEKTTKSGQLNLLYKQKIGPPVGDKCTECGSALHVAGPMWSGPIHDKEFVGKVLEHVEQSETSYGTSTRMKGMLSVAHEELDAPFYFTPSSIAGHFHCISPPLTSIASALLHAGHPISRSHALAGSLKTTATRQDIHDIYRSWVKENPVKPERIAPASPSHVLHSKEPRFEANFTPHPDSVTKSSKVKLVRYQQNPTSHWGPGSKPSAKRKRGEEDEGAITRPAPTPL